MGDMGDEYRDYRTYKRSLRETFGQECPRCRIVRPKASPSILLPGQRCRVDGYVDPRPESLVQGKGD